MVSYQMTVPQGDMHIAHTMFFPAHARVNTARFVSHRTGGALHSAPAPVHQRQGDAMTALEKRSVSMEELDAMTAVELPDREMLSLITVNINNLLSNLSVKITFKNIHIAATICG